MSTEDKLRQLPKWARDLFQEQEIIIEHMRKVLNSAGDESTDSFFVNMEDSTHIHLPSATIVGFYPDENRSNWVEVQVNPRSKRLQLGSTRPMVIRANASNQISISFE